MYELIKNYEQEIEQRNLENVCRALCIFSFILLRKHSEIYQSFK